MVAERQIKIEEAQIDTALKTAGVQLEKDEEAARQRLLIKSILARRTALDYLTSLL